MVAPELFTNRPNPPNAPYTVQNDSVPSPVVGGPVGVIRCRQVSFIVGTPLAYRCRLENEYPILHEIPTRLRTAPR